MQLGEMIWETIAGIIINSVGIESLFLVNQ